MSITTCASSFDTSLYLGGIAVGLAVITIVEGHFKSPLEQLGQRPMGRNLKGWLRYSIVDGVGAMGYDPILGCWAPQIRALVHLCAVAALCALAGTMILGPKAGAGEDDDGSCFLRIPYTFWGASGVTATIYALSIHYIHHVMLGVSHPGGPRAHKIQRQPKWDEHSTTVHSGTWRCAVAKDSHEDTKKQFRGTPGKLSGEPFGRQMWTTAPGPPQPENKGGLFGIGKKSVDEQLVQEMASGGRPEGFNASVNPNR
jgi:hypothetical protein